MELVLFLLTVRLAAVGGTLILQLFRASEGGGGGGRGRGGGGGGAWLRACLHASSSLFLIQIASVSLPCFIYTLLVYNQHFQH